MSRALRQFNDSLPKNPHVRLTTRHGKSWIALTPLDPQPEPFNLTRLKTEIERRWPMTSLMDMLKETDLRVDFTQVFTGMGTREGMDRATPECVKADETIDDQEFRSRRAGSSASADGVSGGLIQAAVGTAGGVGCPRTNRSGCVVAAAVSTT